MTKERIIQVAEGVVSNTQSLVFSYMPSPEIKRVKGLLAAPYVNGSVRFNKSSNLILNHVDEGRYLIFPPDERVMPLNETLDGSPIKGVLERSTVVSGKSGSVIGKIYLIVESDE